jgi:predicted phosphodiesterase
MAPPRIEWPESDGDLIAAISQAGSVRRYATGRGIHFGSVYNELQRRNIALTSDMFRDGQELIVEPITDYKDKVRTILAKSAASVETLADTLDISPRRVREVLDGLRHDGYRIPDEPTSGGIVLERVPAATVNVHPSLLEGDEITVGVVSDTHLASRECAYEHLELAYDVFAERGIKEVWHAGDLVAGVGIYPTQVQDLTHHTFESQVENAVLRYPGREGITTRLISGNHDIEGSFGRLGANPVVAVCNRRDDMEFLGDYTAVIELPNGARAQLVHGRGGGSYAASYKPQKWVEGLPAGRKPAIVVFGHWHIRGTFAHRGVELMLGGCFEWQTNLLVRLGLQPAVGFHILTLRLGADGSLVKSVPEWHQFHEGRVALGS